MKGKLKQKSEKVRKDWVQLDALACGTGWDEGDLEKPQILIEDVFGSSHPGSFHLNELLQEVAVGVLQEGGKPAHFHGTDLCDGWAMLHDGMNYILPSREALCDLVELHGRVIPWDALVLVSSCDKSMLVHTGPARVFNREVAALLARRRKKWKAPLRDHSSGILRRYTMHAASAMKGAYLED